MSTLWVCVLCTNSRKGLGSTSPGLLTVGISHSPVTWSLGTWIFTDATELIYNYASVSPSVKHVRHGFNAKRADKWLCSLRVKDCPSMNQCIFASVLNVAMLKYIASLVVMYVPSIENTFYHLKIIAMIIVT